MDTTENIKPRLQSFGNLLRAAWKSYVERFRVLVGIFAIPVVGGIIVSLMMEVDLAALKVVGIILAIVLSIIFYVASLALIHSVFNNSGIKEAYRFGFKNFFPFIWLTILSALSVAGGMIMLIIPGIVLYLAFSFGIYVFVGEGLRGFQALGRSAQYVKGYWWPVFWRYLGLFLLALLIVLVIGAPALLLGRTASNIISSVLNLFFAPFAILFVFCLYKDLVEKKAGLLPEISPGRKKFYITSAIMGLIGSVILAILAGLLIGSLFLFKEIPQDGSYQFDFSYPETFSPATPAGETTYSSTSLPQIEINF